MATFISNSVAETIAFARAWAEALMPSDVVAVVGVLGAGKTHFVKGLVQGLASADEVTSPTFTLIHEYRQGRLPVFHFDFFRLKDRAEIDEIGFDEYLNEGGIVVVEWADRFPQVLPKGTRWLRIDAVSEAGRAISEEKK
jgi:tRNA threonylcarbamoyladenosine biosynthesis protein TsaE